MSHTFIIIIMILIINIMLYLNAFINHFTFEI